MILQRGEKAAFLASYKIFFSQQLNRWLRGLYRWKHFSVKLLYRQRGRFAQPITHFALTLLVFLGVYFAPYLESMFNNSSDLHGSYLDTQAASLTQTSLYVPRTARTGVRGDITEYVVKRGETLSQIAKKFGVSLDTIIWANRLRSPQSIRAGQSLKIPPVTGIIHRVRPGDTVYSLAKKYRTDAQKIVDFPFNTFADDESFTLRVGQTLIIPDGIMPSAKPPPTYYARSWPVVAGKATASQFIWPTSGVITQGYSWYHRAIDIANPAAPNILAANSGVVQMVIYSRYGYGHHIVIDHGNGYRTLYAHLSRIYVKVGQRVSQGQALGRMGSTGHSTGTHLHFEIRRGSQRLNPLNFLK